MKIKYGEFKKELNRKIVDLTKWLESIERGYENDLTVEDFEETKECLVEDIESLRDDILDDLGEYLED